jgi:hypothetical protein
MAGLSSPPALKRFFDRVVRRSFGDLTIRDEVAADYLADLLTRFARTENLYPISVATGERLESWLFRTLSDRFEGFAGALSYMRKVYFRPELNPPSLPFFRQLATEW